MTKKNQFELDKNLMTDNSIDFMDTLDDEIYEDGDTINIEFGEMEYDPSSGNWSEKACDSRRRSNENQNNEIEADYRVCNSQDNNSVRGLPMKEKPKYNKRNKKDKKSKKSWPLAFQIVYGILALVCLCASFTMPYYYIKTHVVAATLERSDSKTSGTETEKVKTGTYATIKSNSLDGIPVYENAGDQEQITFIPEGKYLKLLDNAVADGKDWAQIDYCGIEGWVLLKYLHFVTVKDAYIKEGDVIYVDAQTEFGIKGYEEPSSSSKELASGILYGTEFNVKELKNGWAKVNYEGKSCWINMFFMGSYGSVTWKVETLTKAGAMNLRKEPSEGTKVICKIPEKTVLSILEFKEGWGRVEYEGNSGWVMLHYLVPVSKEN